jgi:hypothetical protein
MLASYCPCRASNKHKIVNVMYTTAIHIIGCTLTPKPLNRELRLNMYDSGGGCVMNDRRRKVTPNFSDGSWYGIG